MSQPAVLVLGLGNVICGDDGLGVEAVLRLNRAYAIPDGVQVLDGGTLGLSLLGYLAGAPRVILVDAIHDDQPPGSLVRLTGDEVAPAVRDRLSVHQVGVADLLDGLRLIGAMPAEMVLLGLVPVTLALGLERSPAVEAGLPALVEAVADEVGRLGRPLDRLPNRPPAGRRVEDAAGQLWNAVAGTGGLP
jgi:hydrogenase maturation protease